MFGNTRGADGTWDRGAYEYQSGPQPSCSSLGGSCCPSGQTCSGSFQPSSNCASLCCVGGTCQTPAQTCSDGTPYSQCSSTKPLYCSSGTLINNCQACGCPTGQSCQAGGACQSSSQYFLPDQYIQAESGTLTGMQANTSGPDTYIYTITDNSGSASFTFEIAAPGRYRMEARVLTQSIGQNSFYVGLDSQAANGNNSYA